MEGKCNTCARRHKAAEQGFCEEYSAMPQIAHCHAYRAETKDPSEPVVPANAPSGLYIHLDQVSKPDNANKQA